jgi:NAD(P)-dependent dehydrogenase (short-subunit alcohol dehydrogenase family)
MRSRRARRYADLGNFTEVAPKGVRPHGTESGGFGRPEKVAEAALYFALDKAVYVSGQNPQRECGTVI